MVLRFCQGSCIYETVFLIAVIAEDPQAPFASRPSLADATVPGGIKALLTAVLYLNTKVGRSKPFFWVARTCGD